MRHFIDILTEGAADYEAMINPVIGAITQFSPRGISTDLNTEYGEKIQRQWDEQVRLAKMNL